MSIFQPFTQVEPGYTHTHGGTGLGLTISRRLAPLMGGDLTVESRPRDGSRFTLWLPSPPRPESTRTASPTARAGTTAAAG